MPTITGLLVYPLVQQWEFEFDEKGSRGVRKYCTKYDIQGVSTNPVELPSIGDSWNKDYKECRCKNIAITYPEGGAGVNCKIQFFTCTYATEYLDTQAQTNDGQSEFTATDLVIAVESTGELVTIAPPTVNVQRYSGWTWELDGIEVDQPMFKTVCTTTIKLERVVIDMDKFLKAHDGCIGRINASDFLGAKFHTLLYSGFNAYQFRSENDNRKWRCELTFVHRLMNDIGSEINGWEYIIRENLALNTDEVWQRPVGVDGEFLYAPTVFEDLLTAGKEEKDIISKDSIPVK